MDIEQLNKTQIVLLTLLVSFVTSIATGIVTVSLLDQAPPAITQTINRVVERTVERVVPDKTQGAAAVKEVTVVVKEEDLITSSIDKNSKSLGRIFGYVPDPSTGENVNTFLGVGVFLTRDGILATDGSIVFPGGAYTVAASDGVTYNATGLEITNASGAALLKILPKGETDLPPFAPATLSSKSPLKLGQTVLALSGRDRTSVATGIIAGLLTEDIPPADPEKKGAATTTAAVLIDTTIESRVTPGSPLINMFGEVVGISTGASRAKSNGAYAPARYLEAELAALGEKTTPKTP